MLFKNLVIYNFSKSFIIIKCVLDGNRMTYLCLHVGRKLQIVCVNEFIQRFIAKYFMSEVHQFKFIYSEFTMPLSVQSPFGVQCSTLTARAKPEL